jgi:phospholipid transport system substrate-binding protein
MISNKYSLLVILALALQCVLTASAATESGGSPSEAVKKLLSTVEKITEGDSPQNARLARQVSNMLDIQWVSTYALQKYWKDLSTEDRRAFVNLFTKLLSEVAYPNSAMFLRDLEISIKKEKIRENMAMVYTSVTQNEEGRSNIDFKVRHSGGDWRLVDVFLDGVSLSRNLRTQCNSIIKRESFQGLLKRIENKIINKDAGEFDDIAKRK